MKYLYKLLARWREGDAAHAGTLDDYAFLSWGLLGLYGPTFQTERISHIYFSEMKSAASL